MSVVWLQSFIVNPLESNVLTFQSLNLVIYLNIFSCFCFIIYSLLHNMDQYMQRPPNSLVILKMFGECLVSLHLLVIFLCFSYENNKRKLGDSTNNILFVVSFIGPLALAITYWFNLCLAHNLYITFYSYKNTYPTRIKFYKIGSVVVLGSVFIFSLLFHQNPDKRNLFDVEYYGNFYLGTFYLVGFFVNIYILIKIYHILYRKEADFVFTDSLIDLKRKEIFDIFVKKQITGLIAFIICYFPNNLIQVINLFYTSKFCTSSCWYYQIFVCLMSLSCLISFFLKMTEPYMIKYLKMIMRFFMQERMDYKDEEPKDISAIYTTTVAEDGHSQTRSQFEPNTATQEANGIGINGGSNEDQYLSRSSDITDLTNDFNLLNSNLEFSDFITRLIGLVLTIKENDVYDSDLKYKTITNMPPPYSSSYYEEKSSKKTYTQAMFPPWLSSELRQEKYKNLRVNVRKYSPFIFHCIMKADGITINDIISSLDPMSNFKKMSNSFAIGGRSANPILFTHDKKYLIKTVSKSEKNSFIKMLPEYHKKMVSEKSLLCRMYGIFRVKIDHKDDSHIIIMKNMDEVTLNTKLYTFDMKGSTVDREVIQKIEFNVLTQEGKEEEKKRLKEKLKVVVLKDNDFTNLGLKFTLSKKDGELLRHMVKADSEMLKGFFITDYSIFVTVYAYNGEQMEKPSYRTLVSSNRNYVYSFSIIDFLGDYNTIKVVENKWKHLRAYMKGSKESSNFSVQPPNEYSYRFINFIYSCIESEQK